MRKPFYKKSHDAWYFKDDTGKLIRLGKTEPEAQLAWAKQITQEPSAPVAPPEMTVARLIDIYVDWIGREENRAKTTLIRSGYTA